MRAGRRIVAAAAAAGLLASWPAPVALAFTARAGDTVLVEQALADDLCAAGTTVEVTAPIDGDVAAAGRTVVLAGPASGGVLAAGGTVAIRGRVGRAVRAAGSRVILAAPVGTDAVLAGGTVTVGEAAQVGRDLVVAGGRVEMTGRVGDDAYLTGGSIVIGGTVVGSVEASGGRIVLLPGARIGGSLRYAADAPVEIQPGAQVAGQVTRTQRPPRRSLLDPASRFGFRFAGRVLEALWLLVIGAVAIAAAPRFARAATEQASRRPGWSLLTGLILLLVVPMAIAVLFVTIVGIPLAVVALLLYLAALVASQVFAATGLGDAILTRLGRPRGSWPYLALLLGVLILVVLVALPYVGWLARALALLAGFGALWSAAWTGRRPPRETASTGHGILGGAA